MLKEFRKDFGLSKEKEPTKIEKDLLKIIPKEYFRDVNHLFVWHGRNLCKAQTPKCIKCPLQEYCQYAKKETNIIA